MVGRPEMCAYMKKYPTQAVTQLRILSAFFRTTATLKQARRAPLHHPMSFSGAIRV